MFGGLPISSPNDLGQTHTGIFLKCPSAGKTHCVLLDYSKMANRTGQMGTDRRKHVLNLKYTYGKNGCDWNGSIHEDWKGRGVDWMDIIRKRHVALPESHHGNAQYYHKSPGISPNECFNWLLGLIKATVQSTNSDLTPLTSIHLDISQKGEFSNPINTTNFSQDIL